MSEFQNAGVVIDTHVCPSCGGLTKAHKKEKVKKGGLPYVIFGWIFTMISFMFIPILFGGVAICMGLLTYYGRSKTHGVVLTVAATFGLLIGTVFSIMVAGTALI